MKTITFLLLGMLVAWNTGWSAASNGHDLFQKALVKERTEGDLDTAIQLHQQIVRDCADDRPLAAKALLHLGQCYEKLGKDEARKAYERLVQDYADQKGEVAEARSRLSQLDQAENAAKPPEGVTVRQIWKDTRGRGHAVEAVSPNGQCLAFVYYGKGDLAIRDLTTGTERTLAKGSWNEGGIDGVAGNAVFSPDSSRIAYAWLNKEMMGVDLRIVGLDASEPLVLCRGEPGKIRWPIAWSPDGSNILVTPFSSRAAKAPTNSHYALVSVSDGSSRVLDWPTNAGDVMDVGKTCFSPDGKHIVYDSRQEKDSPNADVSLFTLEGGAHSRLVEHPANDKALGWTPDGRGVLFTSDRRGAYDVWLVPVANGKPQGEPRLIKSDLGQIVPLGFSRNGSYYYSVGSQGGDVFVATLDLETGEVVEPPKKISLRREGSSSSPDWSPDGLSLAYISQGMWGGTRDQAKIVIQNVETGEYRELSTSMWNIRMKGARWSPDGGSFILWGTKGTDTSRGIYRIDAQTGEESLIKQGLDSQPEWTHDGKGFIYVKGQGDVVGGFLRILLHDLETGQERELAVAPLGPMAFALSPDGRQLAFTAVEHDKETKSIKAQVLKVVSVAGGQPRELVRAVQPDTLMWTPDGRHLLFKKFGEGKTGESSASPPTFWRVSVEGGTPPQPTSLSGLRVSNPRMHPDGRRIAMTIWSPGFVNEVWAMDNFLPTVADSTAKQ